LAKFGFEAGSCYEDNHLPGLVQWFSPIHNERELPLPVRDLTPDRFRTTFQVQGCIGSSAQINPCLCPVQIDFSQSDYRCIMILHIELSRIYFPFNVYESMVDPGSCIIVSGQNISSDFTQVTSVYGKFRIRCKSVITLKVPVASSVPDASKAKSTSGSGLPAVKQSRTSFASPPLG